VTELVDRFENEVKTKYGTHEEVVDVDPENGATKRTVPNLDPLAMAAYERILAVREDPYQKVCQPTDIDTLVKVSELHRRELADACKQLGASIGRSTSGPYVVVPGALAWTPLYWVVTMLSLPIALAIAARVGDPVHWASSDPSGDELENGPWPVVNLCMAFGVMSLIVAPATGLHNTSYGNGLFFLAIVPLLFLGGSLSWYSRLNQAEARLVSAFVPRSR
jgi:hypothetical protein